MRTSENGIAHIKNFENKPLATVPGFVAHVYSDNGVPAIGYGHRIQGDVPATWQQNGILEPEADNLIRADVTHRFEGMVNAHIPPDVTPTQGQFDALVSFCYNVQNQPKSLITLLSHGWNEVPNQLPRWCHETIDGVVTVNPGLLERRRAEVDMWNS